MFPSQEKKCTFKSIIDYSKLMMVVILTAYFGFNYPLLVVLITWYR